MKPEFLEDPLFFEACEALAQKELNHGHWPRRKIPETFYKIADKYFDDLREVYHAKWLNVVVKFVTRHAVHYVVKKQKSSPIATYNNHIPDSAFDDSKGNF